MSGLFVYVRNILYFVIFMAFADIFLPNKRYKPYISVVMGLVLISLAVKPVSALLGTYVGGNVGRNFLPINKLLAVSNEWQDDSDYALKQREALKGAFDAQIRSQLEAIVAREKKYRLSDFRVTTSDDMSDITSISITIEEGVAEKTGRALIRVEPVMIAPIGATRVQTVRDDTDEPEIKKIKNNISDFYNLSAANINITVRRKTPQMRSQGDDRG